MATPRRRDLAAQAERPSSRQLIWQRIRARDGAEFSTREIFFAGHEDQRVVSRYIRRLVRAGYLAITREGLGHVKPLYRLLDDIGVEAPRVTASGRLAIAGRKTEQMWQTMRRLPSFTSRDLAVTASIEGSIINHRTANNYCLLLAKAGYLQVIQAAASKPSGGAVYRLVRARNTGPLAPSMQYVGEAVWDPNLCRVVWHREIDA